MSITGHLGIFASICDEHLVNFLQDDVDTGKTMVVVRRIPVADKRYSCIDSHAPATWKLFELVEEKV